MVNELASIFEDKHLKVFSECIQQIGAAQTRAEVDRAVQQGKAVLAQLKDEKARTAAGQRLLMLADTAYLRLSR